MAGSQDYAPDPRDQIALIYLSGRMVRPPKAMVSIFDAGFGMAMGSGRGCACARARRCSSMHTSTGCPKAQCRSAFLVRLPEQVLARHRLAIA